MNKEEKSKMDSIMEIDKVMDVNVAVYETDTPTKEQKLTFTGYKTTLIGLASKMDEPTSWLTNQKQVVKNALLTKLYPCSNSLVCFANSKNDDLILEKVKLSKSVMNHLSEMDLLVYSQKIIVIARANLAELTPYTITEESIVALETDRSAFEQKRTDRMMLWEDKAVARKEFDRIKKLTNSLLNDELDHSIEKYRQSHPEFVNHYFKARKMIKPAQRPYDVLGYITDEISGDPVTYGTVSVEGLDLSADITANGTFRFKSFPAGDHRLIIKNIAYETKSVLIRRYEPEHCKLNVKMVPVPVEETVLV